MTVIECVNDYQIECSVHSKIPNFIQRFSQIDFYTLNISHFVLFLTVISSVRKSCTLKTTNTHASHHFTFGIIEVKQSLFEHTHSKFVSWNFCYAIRSMYGIFSSTLKFNLEENYGEKFIPMWMKCGLCVTQKCVLCIWISISTNWFCKTGNLHHTCILTNISERKTSFHLCWDGFIPYVFWKQNKVNSFI